ncbi:LysR family transcriptional regulator [Defluviimonas sp. WL0050]|uniref:LysR family transcriptional regulator n=1 Tax=Albidovulum litorale TaxID=2984134 RepID=A0ABT2ZQ40_9RHOB|nr:LysR family transcriptional regulator [Defluviimonas sp. WL0050]MCV2873268.1 LysR family transcriptional regulator [Defluviimonas sp. WL0050]
MDWSDVRVFLAVYRSGSTLAASRRLCISQPTVTRKIEALETRLGLTLFLRDTRGFHPTHEAKCLLPHAEKLEKAANEFEGAAHQARRPNVQTIRITAPRRNFSPIFSAILSDFSAENPNVRYELISTYQVLDLVAGEADIALRIAPSVADERLICTKLSDVRSTLFASRSYADRRGLPSSPEEFAGHSFVIYDPMPAALFLNRWLVERISPEQIVGRCQDAEAIAASVAAGLGIGPLSISFALDYPDLVRCFEPPEGTGLSSWLAISPEAYRRPEVRAFAAFFAPRFRAAYKAERERAAILQAYVPGA